VGISDIGCICSICCTLIPSMRMLHGGVCAGKPRGKTSRYAGAPRANGNRQSIWKYGNRAGHQRLQRKRENNITRGHDIIRYETNYERPGQLLLGRRCGGQGGRGFTSAGHVERVAVAAAESFIILLLLLLLYRHLARCLARA